MTDKLIQAAKETVKKLEHISRKLEGHRVWGGMEWEYHAILPAQYLPLRDFVDSQIRALRQALDQLPDTTKMIETTDEFECPRCGHCCQFVEPPNSTTDIVEPIGEIQTEQMERPFNAGKVVVHFYNEPPPVGTKLYAEPPNMEVEPVAKVCPDLPQSVGWNPKLTQLPDEGTLLYAAPPKREWVSLTEEEIQELRQQSWQEMWVYTAFARAVEAKLKEKNT